MSDVTVTVKQLAQVLAMPVDKLVEQMQEAGIGQKAPDQVVTSTEKVKLLGFLRRTHGKQEAPAQADEGPRKITLKRKTTEEIQVGNQRTGRTVTVEVRQRRTYVKRELVEDNQAPDKEREAALKLLQESEARRSAEEAKLREADEKRRLEEEARKKEEERKKAEAEAARAPMLARMEQGAA